MDPVRGGSRLLRWRDAQPSDRLLIEAFECTEPKPSGLRWRQPHPASWELAVQVWIHAEAARIGNDLESTFLIGLDDHGVGAVVVWGRERFAPIKIQAIAVARRLRPGSGGAYGREAIDTALALMEVNAMDSGHPELDVRAWIHPKNEASQRLFAWAAFQNDGLAPDGVHHEWSHYRAYNR